MFKRFLVVFLSLSLILVPCLAVTAAASATEVIDTSDSWIELLDYTTVNDSGHNIFSFDTTGSCFVWLPSQMTTGYVDVLFYSNRTITSVTGEGSDDLTLERIDTYFYRVYGYTQRVTRSRLWLNFTSAESGVYTNVTFYSWRMCAFRTMAYPTAGTLFVGNSSAVMSDAYTPATLIFGGSTSDSYQVDYNGYAVLNFWKDYDYMDVILHFNVASISYLSVTLDSMSLPFTVNYLASNGDSWYAFNPSTDITNTNWQMFVAVLHIDLTQCDRTLSSNPYIAFGGSAASDNGNNYVSLQRITGYLGSYDMDPISYFVRKIHVDMKSGFSSLATTLTTNYNSLVTFLTNQFTQVRTGITALGNSIYDNFVDLTSDLSGWFATTHEKLDQLLNPDADETDQAIQDAQQGISDITAIEDQYAADLDTELVTSEVTKIQNYGNALVFCSSILSRSFNNLGGYQIIYILPVCIGIFLFVCSRVPGDMRVYTKSKESLYADVLQKTHALGKPSHSSIVNEVPGQERLW